MEFIQEYGLFLAKSVTVVIAILALAGGLIALSMRPRAAHHEHLEINNLNDKYKAMSHSLEAAFLGKEERKAKAKANKKQAKAEAKKAKQAVKKESKQDATDQTYKKRLFVLNFDGDIRASAVEHLREEISAVLTLATSKDEVLVRLNSGGGMVHGYGLGASQLQRIRDKNIPLTVSVDKVAASGGYLMACVADKIIAAPFAIIGSIGVLAQIPNFNKLLKKHDVDFEQLTAGEHKRTLTLFGENTPAARKKMQEELEETHDIFKTFVHEQRPDLDIAKVATGEHWLGSRAKALGLVDELLTSDDYLMSAREDADILELTFKTKQSLIQRITSRANLARQNAPDGVARHFL